MDSSRLPAKKGELIEQFTKTFGIEVEFCSHKSAILSYTHIEVCMLKDGVHEWKIETDAVYTLELVSPILVFTNQQNANNFKRELMARLSQIVKIKDQSLERIKLGSCIDEIGKSIGELQNKYQVYYYILETKQKESPSNNFTSVYINKDKLWNEINYHNWDNSTNLSSANKEQEEINQELDSQKKLEEYLKNDVVVEPSIKHGGMPSSQLNIPMSLPAYVWYSAYIKEPTAWRKLLLLSDNEFREEWMHKRNLLVGTIATLRVDEDLNKELQEKFDNWHKYWFWLVSIRELTEKALQKSWEAGVLSECYKDTQTWRQVLNDFKDIVVKTRRDDLEPYLKEWLQFDKFHKLTNLLPGGDYKGLPAEIGITGGGQLLVQYYWMKAQRMENLVISSLLYLTVQKLIAGALGVLSEPAQLELQKKVMAQKIENLKSYLRDKTKKQEFFNSFQSKPVFREYHSFLKDLTPLWFKGTLGDVLASVNTEIDQAFTMKNAEINQAVFKGLKEGISALDNKTVIEILNKNLQFLERLYDYNKRRLETHNQGKIKSFQGTLRNELFPDMIDKNKLDRGDFIKQYELGRSKLIDVLDSIIYSLNEEKNSLEGIDNKLQPFRYKNNPANGNQFLERSQPGEVPPWEGRWDTLKAPIVNLETGKVEFLVEHRNN